jgi:hypothetical protein
MLSFKEWVQEKTALASRNERAQRVAEWRRACSALFARLIEWLKEEADGEIRVDLQDVELAEAALGVYSIPKLRITIGDDSAEVVPLGRDVIAHIQVRIDLDVRASGRLDLTNGIGKYPLYRCVVDGEDNWYLFDERDQARPLTRERFYEALMDLMS